MIKKISPLAIILFVLLSKDISAQTINRIVAVVNDDVITQKELNTKMVLLTEKSLEVLQSQEKGGISDQNLAGMVLEKLIIDKLLLQEAKKRRLSVKEGEVEEVIQNIKKRFKSEQDFMNYLAKLGVGFDDFKKFCEEELILKKIFNEELRTKLEVSPAEMLQYFQQHRQEFIEPERVGLKNILVRKASFSDKNELNRHLEAITSLLKEGASFSELVKRFSEGANASKGGDLGLIRKGDFSQEIENIIFSLSVGEVSDWVETEDSFYLFQVVEKFSQRLQEFSEVQEKIRSMLLAQKINERFKSWVEELKEKAYIYIPHED